MGMKDKSFSINDLVIHCREGLSTIVSSTKMGDKDYFLVRSNNGAGENIYVPCDRAGSIIRHVMSEKEADELLAYMKAIQMDFNTNTKQRRDDFKRRLSSGDVKEIAYLTVQLHYYDRLGPENDVIKLGPVDLDILSYARNMLLDELAVTYNKDRNEIHQFIVQKISK